MTVGQRINPDPIPPLASAIWPNSDRTNIGERELGWQVASRWTLRQSAEADDVYADQSQEQLRILAAAVESAAEAVIITDAELDWPGPHIVFVNPAFTKITGFSFDEAIGQTPRFLQGANTERRELDRLRRELPTRHYFHGQTNNYRKNGEEFVMDWRISPVRNNAGRVTHYVAIQQDITDEVRSRQTDHQARAMETLGRLAGGMAHDLNNTFTVILGSAHALCEPSVAGHLPESNSIQDTAREIIAAANNATALIRQLLEFSTTQETIWRDVDLNPLLEKLEKMLRRLIREDIELSLENPVKSCVVRGDEAILQSIVMNLVVNARDAMPDGGKIRIETSERFLDESEVRVYGEGPGRFVLLTVRDTGSGIDRATKAKIFEPFFTTKPPGSGFGLGLASVYASVRRMGGMVTVESEHGRGSEFRVYLPAAL